ncbi:MAG: alpha/beta hydrolase [Planctomycetaceae bacterium]
MRAYDWILLVELSATALASGCASPLHRSTAPLARFENSQVFHPQKYPKGNWNPAHLDVEDAWFRAKDGTALHGWYCRHPDPVAVVLFAHGNAGNVTSQTDTLRLLHDRHRLSVMTFDYRGYGRSDGAPDESGILQDARAARAWLADRESIDKSDVVLIGQSLGGGVMVDLAARDGARGLVLASTFTSLPDVAAHHIPIMSPQSVMRNRLDSLSKISEYRGPLLQIHGDRDGVVPYKLGRKLFDAANEPKQFVTNRGCGHNDPLSEEGQVQLDRFLASLPSRSLPAAQPGDVVEPNN